MISFTSRSSGNIVGEAIDRCCCCCVDFAILPNLIKTCTRRRADNGSLAKKKKRLFERKIIDLSHHYNQDFVQLKSNHFLLMLC